MHAGAQRRFKAQRLFTFLGLVIASCHFTILFYDSLSCSIYFICILYMYAISHNVLKSRKKMASLRRSQMHSDRK